MFLKNLIACIKVNGKILRDSDDTVTLPFGCEYGILIKNLNGVRVQVTVSVDGQLATEDTKLIIGPNSSLELERFIKGGNLNAGNKFKFISRSAEVEAHRGVGSDDGLVRVEAWRELVTQRLPVPRAEYYDEPYPVPVPRPYPCPTYPPWRPGTSPWGPRWGASIPMRGATPSMRRRMPISGKSAPLRPDLSASLRPQSRGGVRGQSVNSNKMSHQREPERSQAFEQSISDVGITVPGSESRQQFVSVAGFPLETQSTVIVLHLRGQVGEVPVVTPVTVGVKPKCSSCGKVNKAGVEFCGKCGTALVAYA